MAHINRRYIDSHWLIFVFQGVLAVLFGFVSLFNSGENFSTVVSLIGVFLLGLSIIEFINSLHRARKKTGWAVSIAVAIVDVIAAICLLSTFQMEIYWQLAIIAGYTILRSVFEIFVGFLTTVDPTDRFIWVATGVCGTIMGIVIFNSGHLPLVFLRFFGAYLLVFGMSSMIYGVHNRSQKIEDSVARSEAAKKRKTKAKKVAKK